MSSWVGYAVSVNCGEPLGCYQGTILAADGATITLTKAFRNGFPYPKSQVTLNAADIQELRIIEEARPEGSQQTHSTVAVSKANKKAQRATVCENLQAANTSSGHQQRSRPIDIQPARAARHAHAHGSARRRNEACFGEDAEPALLDDFDFEGNLALFDKQALRDELRAAARPDVVRAADDAARSFRHDENVLPAAAPAAADGIWVPEELRAGVTLRTDDGRRVPAVTEAARRLLWEGIESCGEAVRWAAHVLLARACADAALRLVGGGRRLEARNAHQAPIAVCVAAPHRVGAAAVAAARILASHGARAHVLLAGAAGAVGACEPLQRELRALREGVAAGEEGGGARVVRRAELLPAAPDVVVLALHDPRGEGGEGGGGGEYAAALEWVRGARGAVLALEPGAGAEVGVWCRCAVVALLPGALPPALGQQLLADVAPPPAVFRALGIAYRPPFGASSVAPLH